MSARTVPEPQGLDHVVVSGGTPAEWAAMDANQWAARMNALTTGASAGGAHWVTVLPHHGPAMTDGERARFEAAVVDAGKFVETRVAHGVRHVWRSDAGVSVIVDAASDGHARFAATVEGLRLRGVEPETLTEEALSEAILDPAVGEPDLVVVVGRPDVLPESMVWELAYSELVFLDIGWGEVTANHLELSIDDFNRRHRRFGGLDS